MIVSTNVTDSLRSSSRKKIVLDLDWLPEPAAGPHTVTFLPSGRTATVEHGHSVFEAAASIGLAVPTECGGKGTCGRCRIRVEGDVREPTYVEKAFIPRDDLAQSVRLACRLKVERDVTVAVLPAARHARRR